MVMRPCLVLLYVCFVIRNINYCCSCSFYTSTPYIKLGPISPMHASAAGLCACVGRRKQPNDQDNLAGRVNWSLLAERCLKSYCSVVSLFFRHVEELFRKSAAELRRCCSTSEDISLRVASTWTLLLDTDQHLDDSESSVKFQRKRPGRLVRTRLLDADTPTHQFIGLLAVVRRRSQNMPTHAGSTWFVVNVRLTTRLQSLPLARCWPACFALFSSFSLAVFV